MIECPKCGNQDVGKMTHWEDSVIIRKGIHWEDGILMIDGEYEEGGDGDNGRLHCSCGHEFPIPESVDVDFY